MLQARQLTETGETMRGTVRLRLLISAVAVAVAVPLAGSADAGLRRGWAVDGDTVRLASGASVRVIGVDTPERGECGYDRATAFTDRFVSRGFRLKKSATTDNMDHYDRMLRYVRKPNGADLGAKLIKKGLANARYDSTDGYDWHRKQAKYHRLDKRVDHICGKAADNNGGSGSGGNLDSGGAFVNCDAARAAGAAPVYRGDPGYGPHLDRDGDGIGCE